ncbi:hypothetical protein PCANC_09611 [Puccinia coronata f. sp. avenae]|uniref:Uncharacterized protein n=1 Tax=Puccinia coronata f. sp. avenae TaxID=200324 RepID=A0A2N5V1L4_9BASI|nr:hypothetical protein PCANC_09611 [Puccinia coronata f. sp. avenae]
MTNNDRYIGHPPDEHYTDLLILIIHRRTDTSHPLDDRYPLHPVDNQYRSHPVDDRRMVRGILESQDFTKIPGIRVESSDSARYGTGP